jgi:undecaprenyl phosphate N,N'-diacetylbacillosamine 1-phosphate transferase
LIFKPAGDYSFALLLLILLTPLMLVVICFNYVLYGHLLFVQRRPGRKGKIFNIYKLRTLINNGGDNNTPTRFGSFLRKSSLDEVPQIINILKGEMSFVGPRPLLEEYLQLYNNEHSKRHNLLPGITGLAQVRGRNATPWQQRLDFDSEYVSKVSFNIDFKILLFTILAVGRTKEVNTVGLVGSEKFQGYYAKQ